jgi:hypothetical protein
MKQTQFVDMTVCPITGFKLQASCKEMRNKSVFKTPEAVQKRKIRYETKKIVSS